MNEILVVDDNDLVREWLVDSIREYFDVIIHTASSSQDAIAKLQKENVSLIICDFEMPEGNGLEVLDFVEEKKILAEFIFFTGLDYIEEFESKKRLKIIYNKNIIKLINFIDLSLNNP